METTFIGRSVRQFIALQGVDRAVVLSSQAFTALIPLLLLVTALAPAGKSDVVGAAIIQRFRLGGDSANAVNQLFAHTGAGSTGALSVFLLLFSGVSLARRLQRMYLQAWGLEPSPGVGRALNAALGLAVLILGIGLLYLARTLVGSLPAGDALVAPVSVVASFLVWTCVPWLLLDRRIAWRRLLPGGVLTATCTSLYGVASTVYMPRLFESYSERYGLFGVTLALIGWLLCIAFIVVATAAIASEFDRAPGLWAQRLRGRLRIEPAAVPAIPTETGRQAEPESSPLSIDTLLARSPSAAVEPAVEPGAPPQPGATAHQRSP
jgi:membrane protein